MKKIDAVNAIEWIINNDESEGTIPVSYRILSYLEDIGMLPPTCSVTIENGKHTPSIRKWDDENDSK